MGNGNFNILQISQSVLFIPLWTEILIFNNMSLKVSNVIHVLSLFAAVLA